MSRLREAIDHETGEVYRIETTRQAKRRHQRNGGAHPKPTTGQINAAEIWNRQEAKIKKDKGREERRKKEKLKKDAKDARLRELQQEELSKGRISVEDTWGKVNASQNRLHRFFGPPKPCLEPVSAVQEEQPQEDDDSRNDGVKETQGTNLEQDHVLLLSDLESIFTNSPLSPEDAVKRLSSYSTSKPQPGVCPLNHEIRSAQSQTGVHKSKYIHSSRDMMPPPNGPATSATPPRSPLKVMNQSQVNIRAGEISAKIQKTKLNRRDQPVATQVVRDVLSGLCSQDLEDDFEDEEKENRSPRTDTECDNTRVIESSTTLKEFGLAHSKYTMSGSISTFSSLDDTECELDEFDDDEIDDESLLILAATQQLRRELFSRSKHQTIKRPAQKAQLPIPMHHVSPKNDAKPTSRTAVSFNAGDSFAMDGMNDDDLLEGLEAFENSNDNNHVDEVYIHCDSDTNLNKRTTEEQNLNEPPRKRRRILPWIKDPISCSFHDDVGDINALTPSPVSQTAD